MVRWLAGGRHREGIRQAPPSSPVFLLLTFWRCVRRPYIRRDRQEWQWYDGASATPLTAGTIVLPGDRINRYCQKAYNSQALCRNYRTTAWSRSVCAPPRHGSRSRPAPRRLGMRIAVLPVPVGEDRTESVRSRALSYSQRRNPPVPVRLASPYTVNTYKETRTIRWML